MDWTVGRLGTHSPNGRILGPTVARHNNCDTYRPWRRGCHRGCRQNVLSKHPVQIQSSAYSRHGQAASFVFLAPLSLLIFCAACDYCCTAVSLSNWPRFFKLLDHHRHRMGDIAARVRGVMVYTVAQTVGNLSHTTKQPPNQPNRVVWLAESAAQGEVPAYTPGHDSCCLQVSLPCHALSGTAKTCKGALSSPSCLFWVTART